VPTTLLVVSGLGTTNHGGGMTSPAEAKIIVGGPHTCRGWGSNSSDSINTDACFHACVSKGSSRTVSSRPAVLGRVIRKADTGGHT